jgi:hypothetical protein
VACVKHNIQQVGGSEGNAWSGALVFWGTTDSSVSCQGCGTQVVRSQEGNVLKAAVVCKVPWKAVVCAWDVACAGLFIPSGILRGWCSPPNFWILG